MSLQEWYADLIEGRLASAQYREHEERDTARSERNVAMRACTVPGYVTRSEFEVAQHRATQALKQRDDLKTIHEQYKREAEKIAATSEKTMARQQRDLRLMGLEKTIAVYFCLASSTLKMDGWRILPGDDILTKLHQQCCGLKAQEGVRRFADGLIAVLRGIHPELVSGTDTVRDIYKRIDDVIIRIDRDLANRLMSEKS